jgi:hypothetical protein
MMDMKKEEMWRKMGQEPRKKQRKNDNTEIAMLRTEKNDRFNRNSYKKRFGTIREY